MLPEKHILFDGLRGGGIEDHIKMIQEDFG
jgi:hypothetical protein